ncbi:hypothetical protein K7432_010673 [Basidiobolus ranarum]|uniref:Fungal lipase-type domain-containing protein n=1 Tax=Basidiobolus ranarum TaxID=34480 RepID=A0ABR2WNG0_9FUNG
MCLLKILYLLAIVTSFTNASFWDSITRLTTNNENQGQFDVSEFNLVEDKLIEDLKLHAKYAAAAYCPIDKVMQWSCGNRCESGLNVTSYFISPESHVAGYVGYNPDRRKMVISFRGTSNIKNWIHDVQFLPIDFQYPHQGASYSLPIKVHGGFFRAYESIRDQMREAIKLLGSILAAEFQEYELIITGHSLGAAVAVFSAMDIAQNYMTEEKQISFKEGYAIDPSKMYIHTYGGPRVGNSGFASLVYNTLSSSKDGSNLVRVTSKSDPVPHFPPTILGFRHYPQENWIQEEGSTILCQNSIERGGSMEDQPCVHGKKIGFDSEDHLKYWDVRFGSSCKDTT